MEDAIIPLLLSTIAGLSTTIGAFIVFFTKKYNKKLLTMSLIFASFVMIIISLTQLIPSSTKTLINFYSFNTASLIILICLFLGIFITNTIESIIPSKSDHVYKLGIFMVLAIFLHNLPEGIITFMAGYKDINLGITLTLAIALHNIPEGISVAMPIYYATKSKSKAFLMTFISGVSEPIGALLTYLILKPYINQITLSIMCLVVAGIMLYIATTKLIPGSLRN